MVNGEPQAREREGVPEGRGWVRADHEENDEF